MSDMLAPNAEMTGGHRDLSTLKRIPTLFRMPDLGTVDLADKGVTAPSASPASAPPLSAVSVERHQIGESHQGESLDNRDESLDGQKKTLRYDEPVSPRPAIDVRAPLRACMDWLGKQSKSSQLNTALAIAFVVGAVVTALVVVFGRGDAPPPSPVIGQEQIAEELQVPSISMGVAASESEDSSSPDSTPSTGRVEPASAIVGVDPLPESGQAADKRDSSTTFATGNHAGSGAPALTASPTVAAETGLPSSTSSSPGRTESDAAVGGMGNRPPTAAAQGAVPDLHRNSPFVSPTGGQTAGPPSLQQPNSTASHVGPPNVGPPNLGPPNVGPPNQGYSSGAQPTQGQRGTWQPQPNQSVMGSTNYGRPDLRQPTMQPQFPTGSPAPYPQTDPIRYPGIVPPNGPAAEIGQRPPGPYDRQGSMYNPSPAGAARLQGTIQTPPFRAQDEPTRTNFY